MRCRTPPLSGQEHSHTCRLCSWPESGCSGRRAAELSPSPFCAGVRYRQGSDSTSSERRMTGSCFTGMLAHTFCHISERARHAPRTSHHDTCTRWCACVLCVHRHQLFDFAPRDAPGGGGSSCSSCLGRARQRQLPYAVRHRVPCTPWCTDATAGAISWHLQRHSDCVGRISAPPACSGRPRHQYRGCECF